MGDESAAVRAEWRAEEQAWTRAAFERWEHDRSLVDVARDCMHRGDAVTCSFGDASWSGELVAVGIDCARLDVGGAFVDVRLDEDARLVLLARPSHGHGSRGDGSLTTFAARLRELDGAHVRVGACGESLDGLLRVGRDQVRLVGDGVAAYVPLPSMAWVRVVEVD